MGLERVSRPVQRRGGVQAEGGDVALQIELLQHAAATGIQQNRQAGMGFAQGGGDASERCEGDGAEQFRRQFPGPTFEQLDGVRPRLDLRFEIVNRGVGEEVEEVAEILPFSIPEAFRRPGQRVCFASAHVAGDRPWRAGEANQGGFRRETGAGEGEGFQRGGESGEQIFRSEADEVGAGGEGRGKAGAAFFGEVEGLPEGGGKEQDVGEDDGGVKPKPPHRLHGCLAGKAGVADEGYKVLGLGAQAAVFRQVASGLAHEPYQRCAGGRVAGEEFDQWGGAHSTEYSACKTKTCRSKKLWLLQLPVKIAWRRFSTAFPQIPSRQKQHKYKGFRR